MPRGNADTRLDETFTALADPTRRRLIEVLLEKPRRAGELAALLAMSPPALSRHLRTLRRAGIVIDEGIEADARVRIYRVNASALDPLRGWLGRAESMWADQLRSFAAHVERRRRRTS